MARLDRATQPPRVCAANEFRPHLGGIRILALTALLALVSTVLASCGVKSDLDRPGMRVMEEPRKDPSKPPVPLGEPGGTTPPYTTGP